MEELTEEQELELTNKKINKLTEFLVETGLDYTLKTWDNGEGREIILIGVDEDSTEDMKKEYKIKFAFRDNGYVYIDVENIKSEDEKNEKQSL